MHFILKILLGTPASGAPYLLLSLPCKPCSLNISRERHFYQNSRLNLVSFQVVCALREVRLVEFNCLQCVIITAGVFNHFNVFAYL